MKDLPDNYYLGPAELRYAPLTMYTFKFLSKALGMKREKIARYANTFVGRDLNAGKQRGIARLLSKEEAFVIFYANIITFNTLNIAISHKIIEEGIHLDYYVYNNDGGISLHINTLKIRECFESLLTSEAQ